MGEPVPIAVLHADEALVAVDKPAGIAVHRSRLVGRDEEYLIDRVRAATGRTLYLAHRLDRATSGVLLLAADRDVAAALGRQFMQHAVRKTYLGVVRGWPEPEGLVDYPLDAPGKPGPKPARTRWRRLATVEVPIPMGRYPQQRYSLLALEPETGRYQQLRRHLHHVSHHLVGDTTHGRGDHNRLFRIHYGIHRLLLHAWRVELAHPRSGAPLRIEAAADAEWMRLLQRLGWDEALAATGPGPDSAGPGDPVRA
jgi:tRNA pseudouridine65 synthase